MRRRATGLLRIRRWYAISFMMSLAHSMRSRILLLGEERSTFHLSFSFTSSRKTLYKTKQNENQENSFSNTFFPSSHLIVFRNICLSNHQHHHHPLIAFSLSDHPGLTKKVTAGNLIYVSIQPHHHEQYITPRQLYAGTWCSLKDLSTVIDDRDVWWERERETDRQTDRVLRAISVTWWWFYDEGLHS